MIYDLIYVNDGCFVASSKHFKKKLLPRVPIKINDVVSCDIDNLFDIGFLNNNNI